MHFVITALWISSVLYRLVLGQLGALKPPLKPDFWICEHPYFNSGALTTEDCAEAVHQMPKGHERILWHNRNETLDILQFPLIVAHGKRNVIRAGRTISYDVIPKTATTDSAGSSRNVRNHSLRIR